MAIVLHGAAWAQGPGGSAPPVFSGRAIVSSVHPILVDVRLKGNSAIDDDQVLAHIQTRPTHTPLIKQYYLLLADLLEENPTVPRTYRMIGRDSQPYSKYPMLRRAIDSLGGELRYLNTTLLDSDALRIQHLYNDFGYHDAVVTYSLTLDTTRNTSIVTFNIVENKRYRLRGLTYLGMDAVPKDIRTRITRQEKVRLGQYFTLSDLSAETNRVVAELRNNGYPYAVTRQILVLNARAQDSISGVPYDSAVVFIYTGGRYRFGPTTYTTEGVVDASTFSEEMIMVQREYVEGEWYSRDKVDQTLENLYSLGAFDLVTMDTVRSGVDSVLAMRIHGRLRARNDLRVGGDIGYERRLDQYVLNASPNVSYSRLNAFNSGGHFSISSKVSVPLTDLTGISRFFSGAQGGVTTSMFFPSVGRQRRQNMSVSASYDNGVEGSINAPDGSISVLRDEQYRAGMDLQLQFPRYTLFTSLTFHLTLEQTRSYDVRQFLETFAKSVAQEVSRSPSLCDSSSTYNVVFDLLRSQVFRPAVLQGDDPTLLSSNDAAALDKFSALKQTIVLGGTLTMDTRDEVFVPKSGHAIDLKLEGGLTGLGASGYLKTDLNIRFYSPVPAGTGAARLRMGYIQEFGAVPFTPTSSRFIAGGANSVRGWVERDMLATRPPDLVTTPDCETAIANAIDERSTRILGGLAVLEASIEHRARLFNFVANSVLARQLNQLQLITFVDAGNAFFRDSRDKSVVKFWENIGVDFGTSIGYDTPVGPFRFGVATRIYDPLDPSLTTTRERLVFNRKFGNTLTMHVGIGYAF
ncbi:MAG TPA: BamA/TamA family outer membrane protein [Candidatus Kapabacteria bacterium]|nr:BamA/TamA family outer membrane protein [Candidatus Kapabacteria bacterium]